VVDEMAGDALVVLKFVEYFSNLLDSNVEIVLSKNIFIPCPAKRPELLLLAYDSMHHSD
jgi:hypothetical protein